MKKLILIILSILTIGIVGCSKKDNYQNNNENVKGVVQVKPVINEIDYSDSFKGLNGCVIFYNSNKNIYDIHNKELSNISDSPYSTFKIIMTLIGLSQDVVHSSESKLGYDGAIYSREELNKDVTLEEAFKLSCVWYYEKLMSSVDKNYVNEVLKDLEYGNGDISPWDEYGHNSFWLGSSLKISPMDQISVLEKIFEGKTKFEDSDIEILKECMLVEKKDDYSVYGKTGSANKGKGWFVGFYEKQEERIYFSVFLDDEIGEVSGPIAKEILLDIINRKESDLQ